MDHIAGLAPEEFSAMVFGTEEPADGAAGLELLPFRGVRFAPSVVGDLAAVTAPPYDLIDDQDVARLRAGGAHNVVRLILPPPDPADPGHRYAEAARTLSDWLAEGALTEDPAPALYVYEVTGPPDFPHLQRGLIGAIALRPESARVILPHEDVFPGPVQDRLALMSATSANLEPIFLIYNGTPAPPSPQPTPPDHPHPATTTQNATPKKAGQARTPSAGSPRGDAAGQAQTSDTRAGSPRGNGAGQGQASDARGGRARASAIVDAVAEGGAAPLVEAVTADGLTHRLWPITDPAVQAEIAADLRGRQALIADGHHRYATYRALQARHRENGDGAGPWDLGLALLVDSTRYPPQLGAIHRVLPGLDPATAAERAKGVFRISEPGGGLVGALSALKAAGGESGGPAFLLGGGERLLLLSDPDPGLLAHALPPGHSERWLRLDTAVLDLLLIKGVWDIVPDERSVDVVHHDAATALARARESGGTAVIMNPLRVEDVIAVAGGGERVPRKSTSFGPKPRSGLVLRLLDPPPAP